MDPTLPLPQFQEYLDRTRTFPPAPAEFVYPLARLRIPWAEACDMVARFLTCLFSLSEFKREWENHEELLALDEFLGSQDGRDVVRYDPRFMQTIVSGMIRPTFYDFVLRQEMDEDDYEVLEALDLGDRSADRVIFECAFALVVGSDQPEMYNALYSVFGDMMRYVETLSQYDGWFTCGNE